MYMLILIYKNPGIATHVKEWSFKQKNKFTLLQSDHIHSI